MYYIVALYFNFLSWKNNRYSLLDSAEKICNYVVYIYIGVDSFYKIRRT